MYGSNRFPNYTERADRKIALYNTLEEYTIIALKPSDIRDLELLLERAYNEEVNEEKTHYYCKLA
ncbi:hypothetical protein [Virgibacillus halodenitrificans]|uniref:hypothetical protein n=1 Tax=Virgibacillus halodenitrificans TaxID=1482 RepID=UPI002DBEEB64|nr:hypothetical protein [Virgibacillus halodenitrificans]MEC2159585.1 hypothetical protein [Virgibacillus halodenitrificans]